jgi:lipopolysaccharide transport protein LptA
MTRLNSDSPARSRAYARSYGRLLLAGLACAAAAAAGLLTAHQAEAQQTATYGEVTVTAASLDYDLEARQMIAVGNVVLVTKDSRLTSDRMTVQMTPARELEWAKCVGNVYVEKRKPEENSVMTGRGQTLDYSETEQKADLQGDVVVQQSSPRLAKPAVITGSRVDMNLATEENVVHRSEKEQAKVHIEPKGQPDEPAPEPVDLIADRIDMKGATQEYVATGKPVMIRPTSKLQAKRIRFQVEEETQDVKLAYGDDDVIFDGQGQNGSVIHATGDDAVYNKELNEITLTGTVHATSKDPEDEHPTVYQGDKFIYNTVTRKSRLLAGSNPNSTAMVTIPPGKGPGAGGRPAPAATEGEKDGEPKAEPAKPEPAKNGAPRGGAPKSGAPKNGAAKK